MPLGCGLGFSRVRSSARPSLDLSFNTMLTPDIRMTNTRSTGGSYFNSSGILQTAAANAVRFDHDPATHASLGLLLESQATNLASWSTDLTKWGATGGTSSNISATPPDGPSTATTLCLPSNVTVYFDTSISIVTVYVASVWLWATGSNIGKTISLKLRDITHAVWLSGSPTITLTETPTRYAFAATPASGCVSVRMALYGTADAPTFFAWGAQLEAGSTASSYIASLAGAQTTRAADTATALLDSGSYDVLVQDAAGAEWRNGITVSGSPLPLSPRAGRTVIGRVRAFRAGILGTDHKSALLTPA